MRTKKEIRKRLKKRIAQIEGRVFMGFKVKSTNILARIEELKWVIGKE